MLFSINFSLRISTLSLLHQKVATDHILHHLPEGIEKFGPAHGTWIFAYKTFNSWLCRRALQGATKVLSDSPGLVELPVGLAFSYRSLPDGQARLVPLF